jgi:CheY-like chemotaxis protein
MLTILLVDDDPLILRLYRDGLTRLGAQVAVAPDGLAAIQALRAARPDVMVLDLMMPRCSGVDVLRFIRSDPKLKTLPVVVVSNSYMKQMAAEAATLGVEKALLKVSCSPSILLSTIKEVLSGESGSEDVSDLLAAPKASPPPPPAPAPVAPRPVAVPEPAPAEAKPSAAEFQVKARHDFLQNAPATCVAMRSLYHAFVTESRPVERDLRLQDFYRKLHFITAAAGMAECHHLAQMACAFEALLFEMIGRPDAIRPSVLSTIASAVDFLELLFDAARKTDLDAPLTAQALVVDDDPLSNRLVVTALKRAQLQARSTDDPLVGLRWLEETHYDLVLLDIEMPGMDGFELCRRLRKLPGYQKTPVIYVTSHSDFESRARSVVSGGDDLIAKPVFPMELAVKAVAHLLKRDTAAA